MMKKQQYEMDEDGTVWKRAKGRFIAIGEREMNMLEPWVKVESEKRRKAAIARRPSRTFRDRNKLITTLRQNISRRHE